VNVPSPNGKRKHKTGAWDRLKRVLTGADSAEHEAREQELDETVEELQSSVKETRAETEAAKARQVRHRPATGA
jgi:hypothetical protein